MCRNRRQLSYTLALQSVVRSAPTGGWPQLRLVNLLPPFLEHLCRSSAFQSLVRPLVIVEAQGRLQSLLWPLPHSRMPLGTPPRASRYSTLRAQILSSFQKWKVLWMACLLIHGTIQTSKSATQTQTRRHSNDNVAAVNESKERGRNPLANFFSTATELLGVYFSFVGSIPSLENEYRNALTAREKAEADADLMVLR